MIDNERIQSYRALAFARADNYDLPGYDEQLYASNTNTDQRTIEDLPEEFQLVRKTSIILFKNFTRDQLHRKGICFEVEVTPLALGFQIIGHAKHHLNFLVERYFK